MHVSLKGPCYYVCKYHSLVCSPDLSHRPCYVILSLLSFCCMYTGSQGDMSQQEVSLCSWMWQAFPQSWPGGSHDIRVPKKTIAMQVLQEELPSWLHTGDWYPWQLLCMFDTISGSDHTCVISSDLAHTVTTVLAKYRHCWLVLFTLFTPWTFTSCIAVKSLWISGPCFTVCMYSFSMECYSIHLHATVWVHVHTCLYM